MTRPISTDAQQSLTEVEQLYQQIRDRYFESDDDCQVACIAALLRSILDAFAQEREQELIKSDIVDSLIRDGMQETYLDCISRT